MLITVEACNNQTGTEWRFTSKDMGRFIVLTARELTGDPEGKWSRSTSRCAKDKICAIYGWNRSAIRLNIDRA